ncbi:MAG: hypothetical protein ACE5E1_10190 [Phycisphaerae bacterium]
MNESHGTRSLREIARVLFQHWITLVLIVSVGTLGTWAYCGMVAPRKYRSKVSLIFKRPLNKSPITTDRGERALEVFVKAQQQIVLSDLVLARTMVIAEDPTLREQWESLRGTRRRGRGLFGGGRPVDRKRIDDFLRTGEVARRVSAVLKEEQESFRKFSDSVELETPGGEQVAMTETFTLIVDRPGAPENAKWAADILADMYAVRFQELQEELSEPAGRVMDHVIDEYEREVKSYRDAYEAFVAKNPGDIGVLEQLLRSGAEHGIQIVMTKMRESDATLRLALARDKAIHDVLMKSLPPAALAGAGVESMTDEEVSAALANAPTEFLEENVAVAELTKHWAKLEGKRAKLEAQFRKESRELRYIHEEISRTRRGMLAAMVGQARSLAATVKAREEQLRINEALIKAGTAERNEISRKLVTYARLKNDFNVAEEHLKRLKQERVDAMSNSLRARETVTISTLNEASMPSVAHPVSPKTLLYTLAAFLASSLLGIALAFFLDHFDHTLRSSIEAERYLGLPVLGSVKKQGDGLVATG